MGGEETGVIIFGLILFALGFWMGWNKRAWRESSVRLKYLDAPFTQLPIEQQWGALDAIDYLRRRA